MFLYSDIYRSPSLADTACPTGAGDFINTWDINASKVFYRLHRLFYFAQRVRDSFDVSPLQHFSQSISHCAAEGCHCNSVDYLVLFVLRFHPSLASECLVNLQFCIAILMEYMVQIHQFAC